MTYIAYIHNIHTYRVAKWLCDLAEAEKQSACEPLLAHAVCDEEETFPNVFTNVPNVFTNVSEAPYYPIGVRVA
jgi:hypothetical protein